MKLISDYMGSELEIINTSFFKSIYELRIGSLTLLTIKNLDFWGRKQEITGFDKTWEVYKPSIWRSRTEIREANSQSALVFCEEKIFKNNVEINLPRGEKLFLVNHFLKSTFELENELGTILVSFKNKKWYSANQLITINVKSEAIDKFPFLILFAFFIVLQKRHRAAAAAA